MLLLFRCRRTPVRLMLIVLLFCGYAKAQSLPVAPPNSIATANTDTGMMIGTATDLYGNVVPDASVILTNTSSGVARQVTADENGAFVFEDIAAGSSYRLKLHAQGYADWQSDLLTITAGKSLIVQHIALMLAGDTVSVTVSGDNAQLATEQVELAMHQRVLGIIPNFYVVYDSAHAVPLSTKLKFKLALKASTDPVTAIGIGFLAAVDQAANTPDYQQGLRGYGQRVGSSAADGFSDILIGGAILPSLLHQDPRYFYQGTGTKQSRMQHAIAAPFICRGDNGHSQINFSSLGGDLISSSLSNTYYPQSNRGANLVFTNFAIGTAGRVINTLAQEFIIPKLSAGMKHTH
jgi:hypothetical protein